MKYLPLLLFVGLLALPGCAEVEKPATVETTTTTEETVTRHPVGATTTTETRSTSAY